MGIYKNYIDDNYIDNNDLEVVHYLNKRKNNYQNSINNNVINYKNNIEAYDEYINFIAYLVKCMSLPDNVISASTILSLITKEGVFSNNHKLYVGNEILDELYGFLGINIIKGNAVCRHMASFQSDVLKKLNYMSEPLYCYLSNKKTDDYDKKAANHSINLIEYNNCLYGFDGYNNGLFKFVSGKEMIELFKSAPHYIYYKPYMNIIYNNETIYSVKNLLEIFNNFKDKSFISIDEYEYIVNEAEKVVFKNKELMDEFHESSKKYIKRIMNGLK